MADATQVMQFFANGVSFGAILALAAIGLSLVYGILKLSNFAHGDFLTLGAFASLWFSTLAFDAGRPFMTVQPGVAYLAMGISGFVALIVVVDTLLTKRLARSERIVAGVYALVTFAAAALLLARATSAPRTTNLVLVVGTLAAIGAVCLILVLIEFVIWRPLRKRRATTLTFIIVSIGISLIVRNALQLKFGGANRGFNRPSIESDRLFGIIVSDAQQFTLVAAIVIIALVHAFLKYTRAGKAMRALADNPDLARVSGIDVDRMIVYVWIITGALVTVAGVLLTLVQNNIMNVNMGFTLLIALFASVILGGVGSAYGAMIGGFLVGIAMKTSALWPLLGTRYELAAAFILLIIVMIIRPQGILGAKA